MALGNEHFQAHVRSRSVQPPRTLYKYTTIETARNVLSMGKLRYQSPLNYNDPFDSQWDTLWPLRTERAADKERALLERALRDRNSWPSDMDPQFRTALDSELSRIAGLPELDRKLAEAQFLAESVGTERRFETEVGAQTMRDLRRRLRVLCLCESDRSVLMWSHYSAQHRGVVLAFDSNTFEHTLHRPFEKVAYHRDLPNLVDEEAWARSAVFGLPCPAIIKEEDARQWPLRRTATVYLPEIPLASSSFS